MPDVITDNIDLWTSALLSKSTAGRGSNGKLEAYGIKKLRGLILELAVRGKLVPQEPNDRPASEILNEIAAEKKQLVKEGKIQVPKPLPEISVEEMNYSLPKGWEWVRFGTIAQHNSGKTLDSGRNTGQLRDYITTSNLYWGRFDLDNIRQMQITDKEIEKCTAIKGDLLICEGGEAGRAAVWPYDHDVCFQNHIHRARFYGELDPYYLYRFFEKLNATGEIDLHRKGVGISNMSSKALALIVLSLPPLAEQHRIVAKIDELMALCDQLEQQQTNNIEAHQTLVETLLGTVTNVESQHELSEAWTRISNHFDTLFTTEQSIDQLKQTILQLAVMGKLVPQDPNDEPASVLLDKIAKEKKKLVKEGGIKKQKELTEIVEDEKPFAVPIIWEFSYLQDLCELITDGTHQTPTYTVEGRPFISAQCVKPFRFLPENCRFVSENDYQDYIKSRKPEYRDVLLARVGAGIGEAALIDTDLEFAIYVSTGLLKPFKDFILSEYLVLWLNSPDGRNNSEKSTYGKGVSQGNLNLSLIRSFVVSVPPLAEQHRIVAKVNELMILCDTLKARLADAQTTQVHLADTIVEQAVA